MYNWAQVERSESINTIERELWRECSINSGDFLGLALARESELNLSGVCSYCISLKHILIIRQHD